MTKKVEFFTVGDPTEDLAHIVYFANRMYNPVRAAVSEAVQPYDQKGELPPPEYQDISMALGLHHFIEVPAPPRGTDDPLYNAFLEMLGHYGDPDVTTDTWAAIATEAEHYPGVSASNYLTGRAERLRAPEVMSELLADFAAGWVQGTDPYLSQRNLNEILGFSYGEKRNLPEFNIYGHDGTDYQLPIEVYTDLPGQYL